MEDGIFFNQSEYIKEMLKKFGLEDSKSTKTPMSMEIKLTMDDEVDSVDSSKYRGDYIDRKSTSGVSMFMGCCLTSWFAKKQTALAISTTKAEYVFAGKACQQALWMKQALIDHGIRLNDVPIMCDNKCAIDLSEITTYINQMDYKQTKEYLPRVHRSRQMNEELSESYRTLEKRLFHEGRIITPSFITENNMLPFIQAIGLEPFITLNEPICPRLTFHEHVMDPLDISRNHSKEKGKKIASPSVTSSSSSSSDDNEAPSFLEFYDELSDNKDLTQAQREKREMFKCLNRYVGAITKYLEKQK
ncbi:hypothetical protein Tco_1409963 [Tanacetum coccineum]